MKADKIKKYTLINIRVSTIVILACYVYSIANGSGVYSPFAALIVFIVQVSLVVIVINLLLLIATIIKNKKDRL